MPRAKFSAAALGGSADEVEHQFYDAMAKGDLEQLMACWADEDDIVCIHPGGPRTVGAAAIRAAYEQLLSRDASINVQPLQVRKINALASSVHSVVESIKLMSSEGPQEIFAIATNVYHKTAQGWRMVAHHVSPGTALEMQEITSTIHVLH